MMYGFDMWGGGFWMIVFWIAIIVLAVWFLRTLFAQNQQTSSEPPSPMEIAKARYASGEISSDEYYEILDNLKEKSQ